MMVSQTEWQKFKYQYYRNRQFVITVPKTHQPWVIAVWTGLQLLAMSMFLALVLQSAWTLGLDVILLLDLPIVVIGYQLWIGPNKLAQLKHRYGDFSKSRLSWDEYVAIYQMQVQRRHYHVAKLVQADIWATYFLKPNYWRRLRQLTQLRR